MPGLPVWAALLGLAAISTAFAYLIYYRILAHCGRGQPDAGDVPRAGVGDRPRRPVPRRAAGANHFLGMGVIGLGLAAIDGRLARWRSARGAAR